MSVKAALFDFGGVLADVRMALSGDSGDAPYVADYDERVVAGIRTLRQSGLLTALVTNNDRDMFDAHFRTPTMDGLFDVEVFSSDLGVDKPNAAIFRHTLSQLGVAADEAVFFDDLARNVDAAVQLGMQAVLVHDSESALAVMQALVSGS